MLAAENAIMQVRFFWNGGQATVARGHDPPAYGPSNCFFRLDFAFPATNELHARVEATG